MIEKSFGTLPIKKEGQQFYVFLIQHRKGGHWGFPKGHAESNESSKQSAERELKEETNLQVVKYLSDQSFIEHYSFERDQKMVNKTVEYFLVEVAGEPIFEEKEVVNGGWFSLSDANKTITYQESRYLLEEVVQFLENSPRMQ